MAHTKRHTKVLMTTDTVGGVWTYCIDLCEALRAYEVQVHLVTMGDAMSASQRREVEALMNVVVHETTYRLEWMENPWQEVQDCGEYLLALEREIEPDLIQLNCYAYGSLPFTAPVMVVAHSDVWSWFLAVKGEEPPAEWNEYYRCVKSGLRGTDKIVAPSRAMLQAIQTIYGIEKGVVIYNGRNPQLFLAGKKESFMFSTGRLWDEAKNIKLLVDAAPFLDASLRIAGDNSFEQNRFASATNNVDYLGRCSSEEIAQQLSVAGIYALPAKYEPFGLSILEAALSGCALVLGDISSLREIWKNAAFYVDPENPNELIATLNTLIADETLRHAWAIKAMTRARHFTLQKTAKEYWQCYQSLLHETACKQTQQTA